jgi:predicted GH43/DUF377 family glycosyl hydrolase
MKNLVVWIVVMLLLGCSNNKTADNKWLSGFIKVDSINPILRPSAEQVFVCPVKKTQVSWEEKNVLNPSAIVKDGKVYLIYRSQDNDMTSRLGLAISDDGLHFRKEPEPVFYPDNDSMNIYEWKGGTEDPRIIETTDGRYIMTYTSYDGKTARLCLASSTDLVKWQKHGLVLKDSKYRNTWSKSGAIIVQENQGKITASKINGRYWMYFGDTDLFIATSVDLINWQPIEEKESGKLLPVLHPRPGYFDSRLVEPGPFALLRDSGILLIYNSSNAAEYNDPSLPRYAYSAGQALFDKSEPYKLIGRTDKYFIHPEKPYEKSGEVNEVCFVEGLVNFRGSWYLYYGTADSNIAVAVKSE